MRRRPRNSAQRLRAAVEALPRRTKLAMLRGIDRNRIIVGAYTDRGSRGICPMLAAHRNGGRTNLASFARSWDRYTVAKKPRPATRRELGTLRSYLEVGLLRDEPGGESLAGTVAGVQRDRRRVAAEEARRSAERDRRIPRRPLRIWSRLLPTRRSDPLIAREGLAEAHEDDLRDPAVR
jgi:hypothetical protein